MMFNNFEHFRDANQSDSVRNHAGLGPGSGSTFVDSVWDSNLNDVFSSAST